MRHHRFCLSLAAGLAALFATASAHAELLIHVNKTLQQMTVTVDGQPRYVWPVSTGGVGHDTPSGEWKPFRMEKDHFSKEWDDAPMPNSIFFTMEGHAIHGTFESKNLGKPVSHGCVRLSRANSEILWKLVKEQKMANTKVVLDGQIPGGGVPVARRAAPARTQQVRSVEPSYAAEADDDQGYIVVQRPPREVAPPRYYYSDEPYVERRVYRSPSPFPVGW
jgi:hypothetical protein